MADRQYSREEIAKRWKAACRKLEVAGSMLSSGTNLNSGSAEVAEKTFSRMTYEAIEEIEELSEIVVSMCRGMSR